MSIGKIIEDALGGFKQALEKGLTELLAQHAGGNAGGTVLGEVIDIARPVAAAVVDRIEGKTATNLACLGQEAAIKGGHLDGIIGVVVGKSEWDGELVLKLTTDGYAGQLVQYPVSSLFNAVTNQPLQA